MVSGGTEEGSDAAWRPPPPAPPAEQLAGYENLVEVGRGGDSVVYRARQVGLGREVAVKVLLVDDEARRARFAREVEITVDLGRQHPHIVSVLATGTTASGRPAIVMDFAEAGSLHDRLRAHGPLPVEEVARIGEVLADALAFAHERGVLHRDVKPQNVLVLPTSWVLADFGIARLVDSEHTSSAETFTYRHAAPQLLDGYPPTAADDVWSLGSTLYTLLDGRPPFASADPDDDSALAYLRRTRTEPYRPLTVPGTERIAAVIDRCLAKDPAERWPSASAVREALAGLRSSAWEPGAHESVPAPASPSPAAEPTLAARAEATGRTGSTGAGEVPPPISAVPVPPAPAPRPSGEPLHREPAPVALSAAGHVTVEPLRDAEPTGMGLPDPTGGPLAAAAGTGGGPRVPEQEVPRRSRLPLLLGAAALVVGLVLGLTATLLRGGDEDQAAAPDIPSQDATVGQPVPSLSSEPTDAQTDVGQPNPELAFVLRRVEADGGTAVRASWTDPTGGEGLFVLHQVRPEEDLLGEFPTGTVEGEMVHPVPLGRSCYYMTVVTVTDGFGISDEKCLTRELPGG